MEDELDGKDWIFITKVNKVELEDLKNLQLHHWLF